MPTSVNVRILITTRFQEVAFARPFLVSRLGKVASVNLLLTRARREADESTAAKDLADGDLDGHPLAVSLAGAYLRKVKNLDISVYLERLRKRGLTEELEKAAKHAGHIIADHERSIAATFQMSHDLLDSSDSLDFLAICLLDLSAFLAPGVEIDASLLIRMARVYAQDSETDEAELAATRLEEISLLEPNRRMHTLVADYVRWSQTPARSRSCCARMLETINSFFPPNMEEDAWKILMPGRKDGWEELTVARRQHIDALNRLADKMAERHSKIAKPLLHKLAISHLNIGEVFFKQGAFSKAANEFILAEGVFKRLAKGGSRNSKWLDGLDRSRLCINRALRESGDIDTVHSIKETMNILKGQTKRRKARQRKQAAGRGRKFYEKQGISSMDQQAAQENLAVAKENAREEIRIFDAKNPSLIHQATPEKATELYQIAGLHMQLGQFQEAKRIYKNILAIDPDNARWLQDLATCHRKCGYVLWQRGHRRESSAEYNRARNLLRKLNLISEDTIYVQWQLELVNLCQDFASLNAVDSTLRREAIKYLEEGIQILNELDKKSQLPSSHRNKIRWFEMRLRQLSD